MNHTSTMEVFTFSAITEIATGNLIPDGEGGECALQIWMKGMQEEIPLKGSLIHAQLAEAQRSTYHKLVLKTADNSTFRTIVSCRNWPDIWYKRVREAMLEQLEANYANGLSSFVDTIIAHNHLRGTPAATEGICMARDPWYA